MEKVAFSLELIRDTAPSTGVEIRIM